VIDAADCRPEALRADRCGGQGVDDETPRVLLGRPHHREGTAKADAKLSDQSGKRVQAVVRLRIPPAPNG